MNGVMKGIAEVKWLRTVSGGNGTTSDVEMMCVNGMAVEVVSPFVEAMVGKLAVVMLLGEGFNVMGMVKDRRVPCRVGGHDDVWKSLEISVRSYRAAS